MLKLNTIRKHAGATHQRKRLGRGSGSGLGPTAGKGDKGQLARTGGSVRPGFEGGQMPLYRRIPKRGFKNVLRRAIVAVNVADFDRYAAEGLKEISLATLSEAGLIKGQYERLNVLGTGAVTKALNVKAHKVTTAAAEKIQKAGGKIELITIQKPKGKPTKSAKYAAASK